MIIGRKTWHSLPANVRPFPNRFNVVLSRQPKDAFPGAHLVCCTLTEAVETISSPPLADKIESIFILGGAGVYEVYVCVYVFTYTYKYVHVRTHTHKHTHAHASTYNIKY